MRMGGTALITALFIMTLVAIAATSMSLSLQIDIYRTNLKINADKAYLASQTVNFWAMSALQAGFDKKKPQGKEARRFILPMNFPHTNYPYPQAAIKGELLDLQALYNLNNLTKKESIPGFLNFLKQILTDKSLSQRQKITFAIINWLQQPKPGTTVSDKFYLSQKPSYLPSHLSFANVSELKLVQGMDAKSYQLLLPYITVLPQPTAININKAPKAVLFSLSYGIKEQQVTKIIQARGKKGFKDNEEATKILGPFKLNAKSYTLNSEYFLVTSEVKIAKQTLRSFVKLHATKKEKKKTKVSIITESLNSRS